MGLETLRSAPKARGTEETCLLVLVDGQVVTVRLPSSGYVVVGRADECDVTIAHPSISRRHAKILLGSQMQIEDLDSSNGTLIRGQRLEPSVNQTISVNESFSIGDITLVVQKKAQVMKARRLWNHDYFEGRLQEECAQATRRGVGFTFMTVSFDESIVAADIHHVFGDVLRDVDVVGIYSPKEFEIILLDATGDDANLVKWRLLGGMKALGLSARISVAEFPKDGRDADKLMAVARNKGEEVSPKASDVIVEDESMRNLHKLARRVAVGSINVLLLGETGVGKQVLAETVHQSSKRAGKSFLQLNCSAFTETLLESELFGHEKGAFTGADQIKVGLLETAHGGTVFLDEIGDMELSLQAKLLRVIENQEVLRVGGLKARPIDVRFIAATNRDLEADVAMGTFRQDLLFRINGVTLEVPPLRERKSELLHLAQSFLDIQARKDARPPLMLSKNAEELLLTYSWPGNIRELRNVMERATLLADGNVIDKEHLPREKMAATFTSSYAVVPDPLNLSLGAKANISQPVSQPGKGAPRLDEGESHAEKKAMVLEVLNECGGNNTEAAKVLGVSRRTLGKWLKAYGIPRPRQSRQKKA